MEPMASLAFSRVHHLFENALDHQPGQLTQTHEVYHLKTKHTIHVWYIYLHLVEFYGKN